MVIYGSGSIVSALMQKGLIDDYRLFVVPIVLGSGKGMFSGIEGRVLLRLLELKNFGSGVVLLRNVP